MQEIVTRLSLDPEEQVDNGGKGAGLTSFIRAIHDVKFCVGSKIKAAARKWTISLKIKFSESHQLGSGFARPSTTAQACVLEPVMVAAEDLEQWEDMRNKEHG
jgi:hypothetical protein